MDFEIKFSLILHSKIQSLLLAQSESYLLKQQDRIFVFFVEVGKS